MPFKTHLPLSLSQKAPSAKRRIKTVAGGQTRELTSNVRKHRAPKGALRPEYNGEMRKNNDIKSESTERQKVH